MRSAWQGRSVCGRRHPAEAGSAAFLRRFLSPVPEFSVAAYIVCPFLARLVDPRTSRSTVQPSFVPLGHPSPAPSLDYWIAALSSAPSSSCSSSDWTKSCSLRQDGSLRSAKPCLSNARREWFTAIERFQSPNSTCSCLDGRFIPAGCFLQSSLFAAASISARPQVRLLMTIPIVFVILRAEAIDNR